MVSDVMFKNAELCQLQDEFHTFRIPRGYMASSAMAFYVQQIMSPHTDLREPVSTITI
jgi:hypothetical protein